MQFCYGQYSLESIVFIEFHPDQRALQVGFPTCSGEWEVDFPSSLSRTCRDKANELGPVPPSVSAIEKELSAGKLPISSELCCLLFIYFLHRDCPLPANCLHLKVHTKAL